MMTTIDELEDLLRLRKRSWSEVAKELGARPGLRQLRFTGDLIRTCMESDLCFRLLSHIDDVLPKDWAIWDGDGKLVRIMPNFTPSGEGCHHDIITIIVMSKEWQGPEEGGLIEYLPLPPANREFMTRAEFDEILEGNNR